MNHKKYNKAGKTDTTTCNQFTQDTKAELESSIKVFLDDAYSKFLDFQTKNKKAGKAELETSTNTLLDDISSKFLDFQAKYNKVGKADTTTCNQVTQAIKAELKPYTNVFLEEVSNKSYTQSEINDSIEDKTVKLKDCITGKTLYVKKKITLYFD